MSLNLPPLPYALHAPEPCISRRTLAAHHGNHHDAYVERLVCSLGGDPLESAPLDDIVLASASQDTALFNAAAQAWNHQFHWKNLRPGVGGEAHAAIAQRIEECFGSQQAFRQQFVPTANDHFAGSRVSPLFSTNSSTGISPIAICTSRLTCMARSPEDLGY